MLWMALKNLAHSRGRSFLTIAGMALGVGAIISLVGIADGLRNEVVGMLSDMQGVYVMQEGVPDDLFSRVPREYIEEIGQMDGVKTAFGEVSALPDRIEGEVMMGGGMSLESMIGVMGVEADKAEEAIEMMGYKIVRGRSLNKNDKKSVLIGETVADQYNKNVGMTMQINDDKYTIVGIMSASADLMGQILVIPLDEVYGISTIDEDEVSIIGVTIEEDADATRIAERIDFKYDDLEAWSASEFEDEIGDVMGLITNFFWAVSLVAALIGGIGIINTMLMSVMERINEFGLLKSVGWTDSNVLNLVMFEALWVGIIGGIVGICVGGLGIYFINDVVDWTATMSIEISITAFLFSTVLALISGVYPAYRATKIDPIDALRFG